MSLRVWQRWTGTPFAAVARHLPRAGTILDLGCGFGMFAALLALESPARRVVGLDVDAGRVALANELFGDLATFRRHDFADPAALPSADAAVFYDVLHHLPDADATLRTVRSPLLVVKENDVEPLPKHLVSLAIEGIALATRFTPSSPVRMRSRAAWADAITAAGYRVDRAEHLRARAGFFVPHALFVAGR
jgi:SAM-dependent methyltransferase